jgi:CheY-like chemotaxis protein
MVTPENELVLLDRSDIEDPAVLDFTNDDAVMEYFERNPELLTICTRDDPEQHYLRAKRFSFLGDPWLQRAQEYRLGEPCEMVITDTNSRLYAFGEIVPGVEGRCAKLPIRAFIKDCRFLPLRIPEGAASVGPQELASASLDDEEFWRFYYPHCELNPGDAVVGVICGYDYNPANDSSTILLDPVAYLQALEEDPTWVFRHLGFTLPKGTAVQRSDSRPSEHEGFAAGPAKPACRVLLVDDDIRKVLAPTVAFLRDEGFRLVACASAEEAKEAVNRALASPTGEMFDVAIIDIHLNSTVFGN